MRKGACNSVYGEIQTWLPILFLVTRHIVLIRSIRQGLNISLFHKRIKGKLDSHVWISPCTIRSTELHAPSPASPAPVSIRSRCVKRFDRLLT